MSRTAWDRIVCDASRDVPGADLLFGLVHGEHAVVGLKNLLPADVFELNRKRVLDIFDHAQTTAYTNGGLTTIVPYLTKYLDRPQGCFTDAATARRLLDGIGFDLDVQVRTALAGALGLGAVEPDHQFVFTPQVGDVYLINPMNYHAIRRVGSLMRLTMGFFMGLAGDRPTSIVLWG
jgi:hypothetical protein